MPSTQPLDLLKKGAAELGVALDDGQVAAFLRYARELQAWNRKMNLTTVVDEKDIIIRHFLDSLTPCRLLSGVGELLDIGSGGGFPGLPIKIAMPALRVTLMDSVEKKVHFIRHIIRTLGLAGVEAVSGRVESPELVHGLSGSFDFVISRAFAELDAFVSLAAPYLRAGGMLIAMKGPAAATEVAAMGQVKGFSDPEVMEVEVPFSGRTTTLVVMRKV